MGVRYTTRVLVNMYGVSAYHLRRPGKSRLLSPGRSRGGHCLYTKRDKETLRYVLELVGKGANLPRIIEMKK